MAREPVTPFARQQPKATPPTVPTEVLIAPRQRVLIIGAALLALFLGALDALIMSAAMPTIVAELES